MIIKYALIPSMFHSAFIPDFVYPLLEWHVMDKQYYSFELIKGANFLRIKGEFDESLNGNQYILQIDFASKIDKYRAKANLN